MREQQQSSYFSTSSGAGIAVDRFPTGLPPTIAAESERVLLAAGLKVMATPRDEAAPRSAARGLPSRFSPRYAGDRL